MDSNLDQENYLMRCHISALDEHTECQNVAADVAINVVLDPISAESSKGLLDQDVVNHCSIPLDIERDVASVDVSVLQNSEKVPVIEPYEGMEFESEEAARLFYNAYAMHSGFGSRVSRNRRSRKDGENIARNFVCSKEGYRANRYGNADGRTRRQRAVTREGCGAMITIKKTCTGKWTLTKFVREHNHTLLSPSEVKALRSHRIALELKKASTKPHTNEDTETSEVPDEVSTCESSGILEPYEGMELESEEAARIFYSTYARRTGFRSRISKNRRSRKDGEVIARKFVCCKEGFRAKQHENKKDRIYRPRAITRLGCEAMIMVKKQSIGKWVVAKFVKEHNHALLDPSKLVCPRSHNNADISRKMIENLDSENVGASDLEMVSSGKDGGNSCGLIMNDSNNHAEIIRKRKRSPDRSVQCFLDYLRRMQAENPAFFYATQLDAEESLCCIFWADAQSRLAYNYFGDVVYFGSTYRTDNREAPFASFTGLNHHQQPTLFGCVMLFKLVESSFVWIFKTWLEAMSGRHPVTLITNQDEAIEVAVTQVLPKTHHCIPTWKILNEAQEHFYDIHPCLLDEFQKCICLAETIHEFESDWKSFVGKYDLKDDEWLRALYNARQRWVPVYLQDTFFAQMPTRKHSEGIDSLFDRYVDASMTLQEFVAGYERAAASWYEKEHEEDVQTVRAKPALKSRLPIEKQMADIYTRTVFLHFQEEVYESLGYVATKIKEEGELQTYQVSCYEEQRKACTVTFNMSERRVNCSCYMFEFSGILCRHALIVLTAADIVSVPPYYILERWTRNAKSGVGLERRGVAMQTNCRKSLTLRYSDLCKQAIRCAEVGATSVQDYDVAVRALREALDKINASKKKAGRITEVDTPVNNICQGDDINRESDVDITPNSISVCDPQQSRARGRPRNLSSKSVLERTQKSIKCSLCREHGHDKSMCPRLRPIGEPFVNAGGMILEMGPTDLHGHSVIGGEQPGFSDGILCLSLGDHFESHGTPGIPSFGPNNFFFR